MVCHYLHHLMFDPLSAWDKFKADMLFGGITVLLVMALYVWFAVRNK